MAINEQSTGKIRSLRLQETFAALKHYNYRLWFVGQVVSLVGTWMQSTAQGYLIYQITNSPAYLGLVGFVGGAPIPVVYPLRRRGCRPPAPADAPGHHPDFHDDPGIHPGSPDFYQHQSTPGILLSWLSCWGLRMPLMLLPGLPLCWNWSTVTTMTNAIALNSTMFNIATVVGPSVAGLTYAAIGPAWCFTLNGLSFIAVIIALLLMRIKLEAQPARRAAALAELGEGIRYVLKNRMILSLIGSVGIVSIFGIGMMNLLPAWAKDVLHGDVTTNGWLVSARGFGSIDQRSHAGLLGHPEAARKVVDGRRFCHAGDVVHFCLDPLAAAFLAYFAGGRVGFYDGYE